MRFQFCLIVSSLKPIEVLYCRVVLRLTLFRIKVVIANPAIIGMYECDTVTSVYVGRPSTKNNAREGDRISVCEP